MRVVVAGVLAVMLLASGSVGAWGFEAHKFIADRAIDMLPDEMRPFFERSRTFIVEHSLTPDLMRNLGVTEEPPRHFVDLDAYGAYPFDALPHDYEAAVAKWGEEMVRSNGTLPWRVEEMYGRLVKSFAGMRDGSSPYAGSDIRLFSAVLAHYVADAYVPLHAAANYDGQLTGQRGVHARFEAELFERFGPTLRITPPPVVPVTAPREHVFDTLVESFTLLDAILKADAAAIGDRQVYDDRYYEAMLKGSRAVLERRLGDAISGVAGVIVGAWQQAGRPDLLSSKPRPPRRRQAAPDAP